MTITTEKIARILSRLTYKTVLFAFATLLFSLTASTTLFAQQAGITSPATGASGTGAIPVFGTAIIEPFQKYELHYKLEPSGDDAYIYFDGGTTPISSGQLGVLQAGAFAPGTYSLRLRVVKLDGNYAEYFAQSLSINQAAAAPTAAVPTATRLTVASVGAVVTPTFTPPSAPTVTPIPTLTFTPAPQPTPAVGQVTQPQVQTNIVPTLTPLPTSTPVQVAAVVDAPESNTNSAGDSANVAVDVNADSAAESASTNDVSTVSELSSGGQVSGGASSSITRQLGETLAWNRLRTYFFTGMRYSATFVLLIALLFFAKRLFRWVRSQA